MVDCLHANLPAAEVTDLIFDGSVMLKHEGTQKAKSVKYRMVRARIMQAISEGQISGGMTLTEVTAGSTGVALAYCGKMLGLPVVIDAHENISHEKLTAMSSLGATVNLHDLSVPVRELLKRVRERVFAGRFWHLNQYERSHFEPAYAGLAQEISDQLNAEGRAPEVFLCPVGTGGMIQGVGSALRRAYPNMKIVALEPREGARIDGIRNADLFYMGPDSDPYDLAFANERVFVEEPSPMTVAGRTLGASASACVVYAAERRLPNTLIIAPD